MFYTALIEPIEVEAVLFPPRIRLDYSLKRYAFKALKLLRDYPIYLAIYSRLLLGRELEGEEFSSTTTSKGEAINKT